MSPVYNAVAVLRTAAMKKPAAVEALLVKCGRAIVSQGGVVRKLEQVGVEQTPQPFKGPGVGEKHKEGVHFAMKLQATPSAMKEVERLMRLNDDVLRFRHFLDSEGPTSIRFQKKDKF